MEETKKTSDNIISNVNCEPVHNITTSDTEPNKFLTKTKKCVDKEQCMRILEKEGIKISENLTNNGIKLETCELGI